MRWRPTAAATGALEDTTVRTGRTILDRFLHMVRAADKATLEKLAT